MSRRDDINKLYRPSKALGKTRSGLYCANIVVSLISVINTSYSKYFTLVLVVVAFLFIALSVLDDGVFWYKAENARRKNNIQDAFKVRLDSLETDGYYNNSVKNLELSYAVNTFESAFFTKEISERMLWKAYIKIIASIVIVIISCRLIADDNVLIIIAQTAFSVFVIEDSVSLLLFAQRINKLYEVAYHEFITLGISKYEQRVWLRYFCVEYESIKAHYKIRLDESLFQKLNATLSKEWDKISLQIKVIEDNSGLI